MARKRRKSDDNGHSSLAPPRDLDDHHAPLHAHAPPHSSPADVADILPLPLEEDDDACPMAAFSAHLVGASAYPNSVKWSEDNLIAVASSQLVTILNPAFIEGPRGSVSASSEPPFNIGTIRPIDLQAPCLLPICLSRDTKAIVRSMDWSPQGFSPTGGCMLAVCAKDFHVKLYRSPHKEFQCEWVEVLDLSDIVYQHLFNRRIKRGGQKWQYSKQVQSQSPSTCVDGAKKQPITEFKLVEAVMNSSTSPKRNSDSTMQSGAKMNDDRNADHMPRYPPLEGVKTVALVPLNRSVSFSSSSECSQMKLAITSEELDSQIVCSQATELSSPFHQNRFPDFDVKECKTDNNEVMVSKISPSVYMKNSNILSFVVVACSPTLNLKATSSNPFVSITQSMMLIALGSKSGEVVLLRMKMPRESTLEKVPFVPEVSFISVFEAHVSWVTALSWAKGYNDRNGSSLNHEEVLLLTGSCDGSVKLWAGDCHNFQGDVFNSVPLTLIRKVISEDAIPVTTVALVVPDLISNTLQIAVGKASGGVFTFEIRRKEESFSEAFKHNAHSQLVTGLVWAFRGRCLYSCSQDNRLQAWKVNGSELVIIPFPEDSTLDTESLEESPTLPNSVLDGYFGVDISKGSLGLATVRGVSSELLDQMYQSRAMKAVAQIFWIGGQSLNTINPFMRENGRINIILWEENILAALHHFENPANKLVPWDVITSLLQISSVVGMKFTHSVVTRWLLSLGSVENDFEDGAFLLCSIKFKESLSKVNCRSLQIVYVIMKRLYLAESHDKTAKSLITGSPGSNIDSDFFKRLDQVVLDVEHELKERLAYVILASKCLELQKHLEHENVKNSVDFSGLRCMSEWAITNSVRTSFEVQDKIQMLTQLEYFKEGRGTERCYICQSDIPFVSTEYGFCQGNQKHKLPRCSVTFKICPKDCWFCMSCGRWASQLTPRVFLSLPSRFFLETLQESDILETGAEAICPYCGILMQGFLPDFLLRLSLI